MLPYCNAKFPVFQVCVPLTLVQPLLCRFSGFLITSFFNCLLILALGNLPAWSGQDIDYISRKGKQATEHAETRNESDSYGRGPGIDGTYAPNGTSTHKTSTLPGSNAGPNGATGATNTRGGTTHVPATHLNETQRNDGLAGQTYIDRGNNGYSNV